MVTLVIMDGLGYSKQKKGNCVKLQGTPYLKKLQKMFPSTLINASGEYVGLSKGQMGNSEVGHLNLGAGRVVFQDLPRINNQITSGEFFINQNLLKAINHAKVNNSTLHIMGLCSDGGVHSHINHLKALIDVCEQNNLKDVVLHLFLDGRDTLVDSGVKFVNNINEYIQNKNVVIGSLCGRVFAMDREKRFDRIKLVYDMLIHSSGEFKTDIDTAFADSYGNKVYDEFFRPTILKDFKPIKENDSVIFFNYRTDRARELTSAITNQNFNEFETVNFNNLMFTTMTEYDADFKNINIIFKPVKIEDNLSKIISDYGLKQYHISETTKYAHVTFFFNGGIEQAYTGEDRKLIESEDVLSFATVPKMKAYEITEDVLMAITEKKYDFILVNLSNADMIGHTGDINACKTAVETVDKCAYAIALATLTAGGHCIITADHGNAEQMLTKDGQKMTSHTTNKVPFILASEKFKKCKLKKNASLCNVAPTVLELLNLQIPNNMQKSIVK